MAVGGGHPAPTPVCSRRDKMCSLQGGGGGGLLNVKGGLSRSDRAGGTGEDLGFVLGWGKGGKGGCLATTGIYIWTGSCVMHLDERIHPSYPLEDIYSTCK